uniref:Uncharacterized protein n=1 Tax=uncultured organism MedDCM-OCT-S11-C293 TaxID=743659 RepID=D6PLD2_9ZZZZ|nr:hypothetical protein [uncultured organism MedDCM-OCT-S11-C293]
MRCLTLAEELRNAGAEVQFVTRAHEGNLKGLIEAKGFALCVLPAGQQTGSSIDASSPNESWLGDTQEQDAEDVIDCLKGSKPDWLITDHYALDETWEKLVRPYVKNIMVIDDLADRRHDCELLLDQNYTRGDLDRYADLVPPSCTKLLGPGYALLRREFAEARRDYKPKDGTVKRLFVFSAVPIPII